MKKVIKKCRIRNHDDFEKRLSDIDMDFGMVYWQHDRVFVPRNFKKNMNFPRLILRTEMRAVDRPARYELILKRHIEDSGVDIVDETVVKDYTETANLILQLGFKVESEVSRQRKDIDMGGGTVIHLDKVENLSGYYAKMESVISEGETVSEIETDLIETLSTLGENNFIDQPYFELLQ